MNQNGSTLVLTLFFTLIISVFIMTSLESTILQCKMNQNFISEVKHFIEIEKQHNKKELNAYQLKDHSKYVNQKIGFVPDTLIFGENQGIEFYLIDSCHTYCDGANTQLQSIIGVRK